jgi:hypothetical protein
VAFATDTTFSPFGLSPRPRYSASTRQSNEEKVNESRSPHS